MAKRLREVWPTDRIAHMWAHPTQPSARNPTGNFSYAGTDLRSYSTTIARRIEIPAKRKSDASTVAFLCLDDTWSTATANHQTHMRQATFGDHVYRVAELPPGNCATMSAEDRNRMGIPALHKRNVQYMLLKAEELAQKSARARTHATWHATTAERWFEDAQRYASLFKVRVKFPAFDVAALATQAKASEEKALAAQTEREKAAREARIAELTALRQELPELVQQWRNTGDRTLDRAPSGEGISRTVAAWTLSELAGTDLMRYDAQRGIVQTNRGADVPAPIVRRMARTVLAAMDDIPPGAMSAMSGRHVGVFAISEIRSDLVVIGCHRFNRAEITLIADALERAEVIPAPIEA